MQVTHTGIEFLFIPVEFSSYMMNEIEKVYERNANPHAIPCLDNDVIYHLSYQYVAICHFYEMGEWIDPEELKDRREVYEALIHRYFHESYIDYKDYFRLDVKLHLERKFMFYSSLWIYEDEPETYEPLIRNLPLRMVW